jgi:hypothetical protein
MRHQPETLSPWTAAQNCSRLSRPRKLQNIGDGHTIADQINEVLEPYDLGAIPASNDRNGGWQLMYQMLQTGQWQIADTCPKRIEAIPSRMHGEKSGMTRRKWVDLTAI